MNCTEVEVGGGDPSVRPSACFSFSAVITAPGASVSSRCVSGMAEVISIVDSWSRDVGRAGAGRVGEDGSTDG